MKTFDLQRPVSVDQAASLLPGAHEDRTAVLLAGGQDLLPEMKSAVVTPERVVSLGGIPGLDGMVWNADGSLDIGALVTLEALESEPRVLAEMALLAEAAASVGSPQIRAAGTLGGNLNQRPRCWYYRDADSVCLRKGGTHCFAQLGRNKYNAILGGGPSYIVHPSDLAPALVALDAEVTLVGPSGTRRMPVDDFFVLPGDHVTRETVRLPGEVLTSVHVPAPGNGMRCTYHKFRERESYDWALSAVALCLWIDDGVVRDARLVLGGVAPKPWRCRSTEQLLVDRVIDDETCRLAGQDALREAVPLSENAYKVPLTQGLLTRALASLAQ